MSKFDSFKFVFDESDEDEEGLPLSSDEEEEMLEDLILEFE